MATKRIDEKHHIDACPLSPGNAGIQFDIKIVKTTNGQSIPDDEPTILFRGRDRLALPMLLHYRQLCVDDGATSYQLETMDVMINKFKDFEKTHPEVMKQPGITKGK